MSATAPTSSVPSSLTVWLAGPSARALFKPEAQSAADLTRWRDIVNTRKREEWEVSRALLAHVRGEMGERAVATAADGGTAATSSALESKPTGEVFPSSGGSVQRTPAQSAAPSAPEGVALSLSHSSGYAVAAASRVAVRVGVDLECERPRDMTRIARFAFTESEYAQLEALATEAERVERFYILWTLKEAFAKALSLPLLGSLRRCTFLDLGGGEWRGTVPTESAWVARTFRPSPTLVLSAVALLPERVSPENFGISTHEWPAPAATAWRTLASLRSGA